MVVGEYAVDDEADGADDGDADTHADFVKMLIQIPPLFIKSQ